MISVKRVIDNINKLIIKSLSETDNSNWDPNYFTKIKNLEKRLLTIESIGSNRKYWVKS